MGFLFFLLLSVLFLIFCHLFCNFLLRLFYCISLFCFMFKYIYFIFFHFVSIFKGEKKFIIVKVFFGFYFFPSFSPFLNIYLFCFIIFCYNFVSFYLFTNNLSSSFLIWNFFCCFKKISSLASQVFFQQFLVFCKLQNYRSFSYCRGLLYDAIHGWMTVRMDGKLHEKRPRRPLLYVMHFETVQMTTYNLWNVESKINSDESL